MIDFDLRFLIAADVTRLMRRLSLRMNKYEINTIINFYNTNFFHIFQSLILLLKAELSFGNALKKSVLKIFEILLNNFNKLLLLLLANALISKYIFEKLKSFYIKYIIPQKI